jgi:hypothetical protein
VSFVLSEDGRPQTLTWANDLELEYIGHKALVKGGILTPKSGLGEGQDISLSGDIYFITQRRSLLRVKKVLYP